MNYPAVQYDITLLNGGLDQVTPSIALKPGYVRRAANFECSVTGGYTRIAGYERFDGHPSPSDALYKIMSCTLTGVVAVGDTVSGQSSTATGRVIDVDGSTIVITRETVGFLSGEGIAIGGVGVGTINDISGVSADGLTDAQYRNMAADDYRADITAVPGSGPVLGVALYRGDVYAWRNATDGLSAKMYKSTASGWSLVALPLEFGFGAGSVAIADGDTVTGATSGATGVVARVVEESGAWSTSDCVGRLMLSSTTGAFVAAENLLVGGVVHAVSSGAAEQIVLQPNGRYETVISNVGGGTANYRLYGADGKNRAFEFDGTVFVPINSTMPVDTPKHVAFHKQHLFLTFGTSLQFSAIADPFKWSPVLGAGELAMNAEITNLIILPGDQTSGALGVYTRRDTSVLYGTGVDNFSLATFNTGTGAMAYTAQNLDQAYVLDDRGIISLGTSLNFGNFTPASLTMNLRPFTSQRINLATASLLSREKGQYRVFFSDSTALYMTMVNGQLLGTMPIQFLHPVLCAVEGEDANGNAVQYFGSSNGMVYQLDVGTSFDGDPIAANINLAYNFMKSPRLLKRYRKASVELSGNYYAEIQFGYDLSYRSTEVAQPTDSIYANDLRSANWDEMFWDNFIWDGSDVSPSEIGLAGTAENISIRIACMSDLFQEFTINSVILHYTPRRGLR